MRNRTISITSACIAGGIPATTGLRWLGVLEKEGLLLREVSAEDARVTWVHLSEYGMNVMRSYIADAGGSPVGNRLAQSLAVAGDPGSLTAAGKPDCTAAPRAGDKI